MKTLAIALGWALMAQPAAPPKPPSNPKPVMVRNGSSPAIAPDGSRIAYLSESSGPSNVFIVSADGTGASQVTRSSQPVGPPQWTGDSKQIVFSIFAKDASVIYSIGADGTNQRQIGRVPGRAQGLSPDGTRALYWTGTWTAMRLFVSTLDASETNPITDGATIAWNTRWSPDGRLIAFTGRDAKDSLHVYVMNANGTGRRQLTHIAPTEGNAQAPAWSPDGTQIAFQVSDLKSHAGHIWIADTAKGAAKKLAAHTQPYADELPAWFPDGKRLAFQSDRTGLMEIWVMGVDGSGQRQITR